MSKFILSQAYCAIVDADQDDLKNSISEIKAYYNQCDPAQDLRRACECKLKAIKARLSGDINYAIHHESNSDFYINAWSASLLGLIIFPQETF